MQFFFKILPKNINHLLCGVLYFLFFNSSAIVYGIELDEVLNTDKKILKVSIFTDVKSSNTLSLTYSTLPRINQVIIDAVSQAKEQNKSVYQHETDNIYWQAAGLFATNTQKIDIQLSKILQQIDSEKKINHVDTLNAITNLKSFFASSIFKERLDLPIELDYHLAGGGYSGGGKINPLLSGDYQLFLPKKPSHVWIIGAVKITRFFPFEAMKNANDYLNQAPLLYKYGQSQVWVISPDGKRVKQGVAYWNKENTYILPGSIIYVPFKALSEQLNNAIAALLQHRVMSL